MNTMLRSHQQVTAMSPGRGAKQRRRYAALYVAFAAVHPSQRHPFAYR